MYLVCMYCKWKHTSFDYPKHSSLDILFGLPQTLILNIRLRHSGNPHINIILVCNQFFRSVFCRTFALVLTPTTDVTFSPLRLAIIPLGIFTNLPKVVPTYTRDVVTSIHLFHHVMTTRTSLPFVLLRHVQNSLHIFILRAWPRTMSEFSTTTANLCPAIRTSLCTWLRPFTLWVHPSPTCGARTVHAFLGRDGLFLGLGDISLFVPRIHDRQNTCQGDFFLAAFCWELFQVVQRYQGKTAKARRAISVSAGRSEKFPRWKLVDAACTASVRELIIEALIA